MKRLSFKDMDKGILALWILFVLITPIMLTPWVHGNDGAGYYAYLRSAFIDKNLDLKDEREHFNQTIHIESIKQDSATGRYYSQYPIGTAVFWAPYFFVGHLVAEAAGYPLDGYSFPYIYFICFGSALNAFFGLLLTYSLLKRYVQRRIALLSTITVWFASGLFYYMYFEPSMSHANGFFIASLFLWFWERTLKRRGYGAWALLGIMAALAIMVRYQLVVLLALPLVEVLVLWREHNPFKDTWTELPKYITSAVAFLVVLVPQGMLLYSVHGALSVSYSGSFSISQIPSVFFKVLFSSWHGLFYWTPVLVVAFIGIFLLYRTNKILANAMLLALISNTIIVAGWGSWYGSQAFGQRFFVDLLPFFIIGYAVLIDRLARYVPFIILAALSAAFVLWNLGLMVQYGTRMISADQPVNFMTMLRNNLTEVPANLFRILSNFIFKRGDLIA